jgi:hypothetical protein
LTRRLRLLDLGLLALLAVLSWQMRREWVWAHARTQAFLQTRLQPATVQPLTPLSKVEPLSPLAYAQMVMQNLFSRDRNSQVIIDPPAPVPDPPVPPFPVARGVMLWEGVPPTVVLSERPGGDQKGYHPGDTIGEWKIVSVDNQYMVLGWNGKEFKKRLDELLDKTNLVAENAPAAVAAPAAPAKSGNTNLSPDTKPGPGIDLGNERKGCIPGDNSPSGTVVGGMKKVLTPSPFGASCQWVPAN